MNIFIRQRFFLLVICSVCFQSLISPVQAERMPPSANTLVTLFSENFWRFSNGPVQVDGFSILPAKVVWYTDVTKAKASVVVPERRHYVNNPFTLYGGVSIPKQDGKKKTDYSDVFQIDGDDVIAIFGTSPPAITYFSFTMNETSEYIAETDEYFQANSSIGLSINNANLGTVNRKVYQDFFVLIIGAQFEAVDQAKKYFQEKGIPGHAINIIYVPHRFTRPTKTNPPWINLLTRLTFRSEAEKDIIFTYILQEPKPLRALFFDGSGMAGDVEDGHLKKWEETLRDDDSEWKGLADQNLDFLRDQLLAFYQAKGYTLKHEGFERLNHTDPELDCRVPLKSCNFDCPDATYGYFYCDLSQISGEPELCKDILPNAKDLVVILGVNHHRFGNDSLGTYFSYAVTRMKDLQGIVTIMDLDTVGSAKPFLEQTQIDDEEFFVFTVSRECGDDPYCLKVPYDNPESDEVGVPPFGPVFIGTRIYLDKVTGSAPNPDSFVPAKLLWFNGPR